jgi:ectoine hydroxylase-related dioxygenase (phytanoyl-CoA dioxygenase family)
MITTQQVNEFDENGFLIIRDFYEKQAIDHVRKELFDIIGFASRQRGINIRGSNFDPENFDIGFNEILAKDREVGSIVYDAAKHLLSFHRLLCEDKHEKVMKLLRLNCFPAIASGGYGVRIDNPGEDKFRAYWHQEYPSQLRSINGVVFWSPLVKMYKELGPVMFAPKSHKLGICKVKLDEDESRSGAYKLRLVDEEKVISRFGVIAPILMPGDVVVVDYLTLHASGKNSSDRSRWSMQFRYFDFADPMGNSFNWKGSFASGFDFAKVHPELID